MTDTKTRSLGRLAATLRTSGAAGRTQDPVAAVVWITISMALLAGLGGFAKGLAQGGMDPLQVLFFRNFGVLLLMLPLLHWRGPSLVRSKRFHLYWVRSGLSLLSMMCWFHALTLLPFGEVTAITFLAPLFGTLCAIFFLGEIVGIRRWSALLVGFLGAMIILRPGMETVGIGQLMALTSAMAMGIVGPLVKHLTSEDDADKIVFITHVLITPMALVPALFVWQWPALETLPMIVGMALCAGIGHVALVRGFAAADASLVFAFEFSRLPFAVLIGLLFFAEPTDIWTWIGATVIFASAVYITRREAKLRRERARQAALDAAAAASSTPARA